MIYKNPKAIAILLAAYNADKFLAEQVDSLITQTNQDWTLYIRNDGSTDNTAQIIDHYCEQYPGKIIEIDRGGNNLGCKDNFFRLLEVVESEYYMFCDADDVWLPRKIEISFNAIKKLEKHSKTKPILVHSDSAVCDTDLNLINESYWQLKGVNPDIFSTPELLPIFPYFVGGSTMLFNRTARETCIPIQDTMRMYDPYVATQVMKTGIIQAIHIPLKKYRQHDNNIYGAFGENKNKPRNIFNAVSNTINANLDLYKVLRSEDYGSFLKFCYYKLIVILKRRK